MAKLYNGKGTALSLLQVQKLAALASVSVEYGRAGGASYYLLRIPKVTLDGKQIRPRVAMTSADGTLGGVKASALTFARRNQPLVTVNAGLFNTSTMIPQGQTVIGGESVTNSPMTDDMGTAISDAECYPLCIDAQGDLSAPYGRSADTADMIADGVCYAVTGWGKFIDGFAQTDTSVFQESVHPDAYIRQCIGQYQNGDYFVCTVDRSRGSVENEAGMTYDELAALLIARGVKFAYSLDGGGSCETCLGQRQVNPIYEGDSGRAVPTVICFEIQ